MSLRKVIHDKLIDLVKSGEFFRVIFDSEDNLVLTAEIVEPESIAADETSSAFSRDNRIGLALTRKRTEWTWQVRVKFPKKVSCESFENGLLTSPPKVQSTETPPVRCVIELVSSTYSHTLRKSEETGDSITFEFSILFF